MFRRKGLSSVVLAGLLVPLCLTVAAPASAAASTMPDPGVAKCDALVTTPVGHECLLPWPNNAFTKAAKTATGRLLNIAPTATPKNKSSVHINPKYQNQNDGFSPGSVVMINIPSLSIPNSNIATSRDIGLSGCTVKGVLTSTTVPIVLWDVTRHICVPYFAELDAQNVDASTQLLLIHPAINFVEGDRVDVLLRNLYDTSNALIPTLAGESAALNGTMVPANRGAHLKWLVNNDLSSFNRTHLYAAWDFSVISSGGTSATKFSSSTLADPALTMRNQAFKLVGMTTPVFRIYSTKTVGTERQVSGSFQVPTFLTHCPTKQTAMFNSTNTSGCGAMNLDAHGLPLVRKGKLSKGTWSYQIWANFICVMPTSIASGGPALPTLYGHGLLGDATEVEGGSFVNGVAHNLMGCATDWVRHVGQRHPERRGGNPPEHETFNIQVDHMLQGFVNFQFLGRLHQLVAGFVTNAAFQAGQRGRFQGGQDAGSGVQPGRHHGRRGLGLSTSGAGRARRAGAGLRRAPARPLGGLERSSPRSSTSRTPTPIGPADRASSSPSSSGTAARTRATRSTSRRTPTRGPRRSRSSSSRTTATTRWPTSSAESLGRTIGALNHQPVFDPNAFGAPRTNLPVTMQWGMSPANQAKANPAVHRAVGLRHPHAAHGQPVAVGKPVRQRPARLRAPEPGSHHPDPRLHGDGSGPE